MTDAAPILLPVAERRAELRRLEDQLVADMVEVYRLTGRFRSVHIITNAAQKKVARQFLARVTAEGWIV